jgi:16S rRNA (cytosine1402-N4)-methyltransferase
VKEYLHTPVLAEEVIAYLKCREGGIFVDATVGEGGHTLEILRASARNRVIGIDQDYEILEQARERLAGYAERVTLIHDDFTRLGQVLQELGIDNVDGILLDLGVSQFHFLHQGRGFSLQYDGPLDMRMDTRGKVTAFDIVNCFPLEEIEKIVRGYGEERWAKRIVKAIGKERQHGTITTTGELAAIVSRAIPATHRPRRLHPATQTFLALRIAVNDELNKIEKVLPIALLLLRQGGRIGVIAFHSLEDRIVKQGFKRLEGTCSCPPSLPQCGCGGRERVLRIVTKRPVIAAPEELRNNPRARSAKLRVAERV